MTAPTFVVARNPKVGSRLPYLLQLTLTGGPLVLKARESWPRTAKVYCHRTDGDWPDDAAGYRGVELEILVDTRERYPYRFAGQQTHTTRCMLRVGDYAVEVNGVLAAAVERKSLQDLAAGLVDGSLAFLLAELATLPRAAVVIEDRYSRLLKLEHVQPGFVAELLAAVQVRYPSVPIGFFETRPLAEEYTFRFLGAALACAHADHPATTAAEQPPASKP